MLFPRSLLANKSAMRSFCRSIHITTESTPNPHSMKFLPGQEVLPSEFGNGVSFQRSNRKGFQTSALAMSLFAVEGIEGLSTIFICVTLLC